MSQRSSGKWVAIVTGVISLLLGIGYLVLVQLLDWRGDWQPAPLGLLRVLLF
ncbi:hypothetical protein RHP47_00560 [Thermosynechococcus sp. QKsg1]|uniref:hypothetical protein n=1 Tax=unclassified Thermosynechococcus TaxID=2622553 RepID=UPI00122E5951|nr:MULTISPECIES: hypothetical protein [unclassified Thermosynechococcus]QEQ00014.1 hypothetical protein FFX45_00570 [Thermosynechococcus sp. CL-1]WJI24203.1 hypothetical protein MZ909_00580 [Thermosynechococcus sp. B0]WKT83838.1 hypothetical protein QYC28_00565 [Thermosynechococcus sp. HY596]WNC62969.1 hypothetical protein RHK13_00565 [Thermosynechococcus sp. HY591]WNC65528.1 hypothetical protein RHK28_00565 [Thermosynechococcus sp. HY593]